MQSSLIITVILLNHHIALSTSTFDYEQQSSSNFGVGGGGGSGTVIGYYATNTAQNISSSVGKTVYLNCSLDNNELIDYHNLYSPVKRISKTLGGDGGGDFPPPPPPPAQQQNSLLTLFNPTWLKADCVYSQNGVVESHRVEKIIVTRKGIIADTYNKEKIKLMQQTPGERVQVLRLNELEVKDEGKYICREFSARIDRTFYLSVFCKCSNISIIIIEINFCN
jgi:hypothetical protein